MRGKVFLAVFALLATATWVGSAFALYQDYFPSGTDGQFNTYPSEGYAITDDGGARLSKGDHHFGFIGFTVPGDGPDGVPYEDDPEANDGLVLSEWLAGKKIVSATLYIRDYTNQYCDPTWDDAAYGNFFWTDPVEILGFRCGNEGDFAERDIEGVSQGGGCCATYSAPAVGPGEVAPPAWHMGYLNTDYDNDGEPDGYAFQGDAGDGDIVEWWKLSSKDSAHPGEEVNADQAWFDDDDDGAGGWSGDIDWPEQTRDDDGMWAVEYILRHSDALLLNSETLDDADCIGEWGEGEPRDAGDDNPADTGWYAVPIDRVIVQALGTDPDCKGLVFSSLNVDDEWGNTTFQTHDQNGHDWAPYLDVTATLAGDVNNDGSVDLLDMLAFADAWGSSAGDPNYDEEADFNLDGSVDLLDLLALAPNWGQSAP